MDLVGKHCDHLSRRCANSAILERAQQIRFPALWLIVCSSLFALGCEKDSVQPDFGAPYQFVIDHTGGAPEAPPRIVGDWLLVQVSYAGGCADHSFSLERDVRPDTAHIWIKHFSPSDEQCEVSLTDDLNLELPHSVRSHETIALHFPDGAPPYMLKWSP